MFQKNLILVVTLLSLSVFQSSAVAASGLIGSAAPYFSVGSGDDKVLTLDMIKGKVTAVFYESERTLATSLLDRAARSDTFPGLPRPQQRVLVAIAPDRQRFREWIGPSAP